MVVLDSSGKPASYPVKENTHFVFSMTNYLHCNSCYFRPGMGIQRRFFITNCSHLYCESCVATAAKDKCKVCRSQCFTLCLSGKIPKEVEGMFLDPVESFQKFLKEFFQRLDFQRSHQKRLMRHLTEQVNNAEKRVSEVKKMIHQFQKLERECFDLKSQNDYLKLLLSKKDGCPRSGSRSGTSPGPLQQSPNHPSHLSSSYGKNQSFTSLQQRPGGGSNITADRLLIRTPPSGGQLGTIGCGIYTPTVTRTGHGTPNSNPGTPLTVPRPIQFNEKD